MAKCWMIFFKYFFKTNIERGIEFKPAKWSVSLLLHLYLILSYLLSCLMLFFALFKVILCFNVLVQLTMALNQPISPANSLNFFYTIGKLKTLKRTGWVHNGKFIAWHHWFLLYSCLNLTCCYVEIPLPESVADHMYRMSMLSMLITDTAVNKDHLMKICMVHDLAESIVGDITPHCGVSKEDKRKLEEVLPRHTYDTSWELY